MTSGLSLDLIYGKRFVNSVHSEQRNSFFSLYYSSVPLRDTVFAQRSDNCHFDGSAVTGRIYGKHMYRMLPKTPYFP